MKRKISTDLSRLSNIDEAAIDRILELCTAIIGNATYEALLENDEFSEIDLGFGTLIIKTESADVKVKFIPSITLSNELKEINRGGEPSLKLKLEKSVVAKLIDNYKQIV